MKMYIASLAVFASAVCINYSAHGQTTGDVNNTKNESYDTLVDSNIKQSENFGETWSPDTGSVSFSQTDISLPGNSKLPVEITRLRSRNSEAVEGKLHFGDWQLSIPRIEYQIAELGNNWPQERCRQFKNPPFPTTPQRTGDTYTFMASHNGFTVYDVNGGSHLIIEPTSSMWPYQALGSMPYLTTNSLWRVDCNITTNMGRDGFTATDTSGNTYVFDREFNHRFDYGQLSDTATIYPSSVTDVYGNTVQYTYGSWGVTRIEASDGRLITLGYNSDGNVSSVTANGRSWSYSYQNTAEIASTNNYTTTPDPMLSRVTLPDGRTWEFSNSLVLETGMSDIGDNLACETAPGPQHMGPPPVPTLPTLTMKNPNGAHLEMKFRRLANGRTGAWSFTGPGGSRDWTYVCAQGPGFGIYHHKMVSPSVALTEKSVKPTTSSSWDKWTYIYEEDHGSFDVSPQQLSDTKKRTETYPTGKIVEYDVIRRADAMNEGLVDEMRTFNPSSSSPVETRKTYWKPESSAYAPGTALTMGMLGYLEKVTFPRVNRSRMYFLPMDREVITRDGDTFTTEYTYNLNPASSGFSFNKPTRQTKKTSTTSQFRTVDVEYRHLSGPHIFGLVAKTIQNGKEFKRYTHNSSNGSITTEKDFGYTTKTYTHYSDGTVASSKDAINRTTSYGPYKRGRPTTISFPDSTSQSWTIDNNGWITSFTDGRGHSTSYSYNNVGWVTNINRPASWADTSLTYSSLGNGIVQTSTRGLYRVVTTYDGFGRSTLVREVDQSGHSGSRYRKTDYDALGQVTFTSLPSTNSNPTAGTNFTYDAIGRPTQAADNVSPWSTTKTAYLSGHKIRVTDPGNGVTTTTYRAFGTPENAEAVAILDPSGTTSTLTRDIHGNITNINQSSGFAGYSVNVDRKFWYDSRFRLCRHQAPEIGHELFAYDGANQMTMSSRGEAAGTSCSTPSSVRRITFSYDGRGRTTSISFPGGTPNVTKTYDGNGNVLTTNRGGANWTYQYSELNQITSETLSIDGRTYQIVHGYDATGSLSSRTLPGSQQITYQPTGFGQPRRLNVGAASYISGITYHPNGTVASAGFSNGRSLSQTLNAQQLVRQMSVPGVTGAEYGYNKRDQITRIEGGSFGGETNFRYDWSGRLDRASGDSGTWTYKYDGLGNIRKKQLGSRSVDISYDGTNRVSQFKDTGGANAWLSQSYDTLGNVTDNGSVSLIYDWANQPIAMSGSGISNTYTYDGNLNA